MKIKKRKDGLVVENRFYSAELSRVGGRLLSLVHGGGGTDFAGGRGLAEDLESGHPGQMAHDTFRQDFLGMTGAEVKVRFTYHGKPGYFMSWPMTYVKTFTFSADSPLIVVEQMVRNVGAPELFAEFRIHHQVAPHDGRVIMVPTTEGLREIPATGPGAHFITDFTEGFAGLWRRNTREALLFFPRYDDVAQFLVSTGKNLATVEWYCRHFTIGNNEAWTTSYRLAPVMLGSPEELPSVLTSLGVNADVARRDRRPQAPVIVQPGPVSRPVAGKTEGERGADASGRDASARRFGDVVTRLVARQAAMASPSIRERVELPDGTVCSRAIQTRPGAGLEVSLPEAGRISVRAEVSLPEAGPGNVEACLGCCDPEGNLRVVSPPAALSFWNSAAVLDLDLDELAGKSVRLFLFGQDLLWTSLSLEASGRREDLFTALRVRVEGAGEPVEAGVDGTCPLVISAESRTGAPRLEYGIGAPSSSRPKRTARMKRSPGGEGRFSARLSVPANETIHYQVMAGDSSVEGTARPLGYPPADGIPRGAVCLYVSPAGSDAFTGRQPAPKARGTDGPFATLGRAVAAARKLKKTGPSAKPVAVVIRAGTYELAEPLTFTPDDSGTPACPVIYMAYPGETVVISGGRRIPGPWEDSGAGVFTCRLPAWSRKTAAFRQLFANGQRVTRARLPREGFFHFGAFVDASRQRLFFTPHDWRAIGNRTAAELVLYFIWSETRHRIAAVDEQRAILTLEAPPSSHLAADRYYVENVAEGLNVPDTWYLDPERSTLSWHPAPGVDPATAEVIAPRLQELVRFKGKAGRPVRHIALCGLTFAHADWFEMDGGSQAASRIGSALSMEHAEFCCLRGNRVLNVGTYGIGLYKGCRANTVVGNEIAWAGAGGVRVGLTKPDSTTRDNAVIGNDIHDGGRVYPSAVGVWIGQSSGNWVLRNHVHHLPYTGISVGWTWGAADNTHKRNRIEHNTLHHLMELLEDGGAIYLLGVSYGTTVLNNVIHHVAHGNGIYPDEGSTGIRFAGNLIYRCRWGFGLHGARDNLFEHNMVANTDEWLLGLSNCRSYMADNRFRHNIFYSGGDAPLVRAWGWTQRFVTGSGGNLYYRADHRPFAINGVAGVDTLDAWIAAGLETDPVLKDPRFADPEQDDYRLLEAHSPAILNSDS